MAFGITDCETVEGSLCCYNYIIVGCLCDREVTEQYFQTIDRKRKRIEAKILKTREEHLRIISKLLCLEY